MNNFEEQPKKRPQIIEEESEDTNIEKTYKPKEQSIEKSRAQIAEEELAKMKIENTKQQGDYKPEFDQYLANKSEDENEDLSTKKPQKSRAQISEEELAKMEILNTKYVGEDEELPIKQSNTEEVKTPEEVKKPEEVKTPEEVKKPEEVKTPEEVKSEEIKKAELEAREEKKARTERAIENLKALFDNKNKMFAQKEKQKDLSYKFKAFFGANDGEPVAANEYRAVYKEYEEALRDVESLTGKSEDQIIKEYLSGNESNEGSVENINKKLDDIEDVLKENEKGQSKEKKDLIEKLTGIKDERVKFAIKIAIAGGMIAFPVAGIAAGALGMGLGEALIGYSFIHYSTALGLAVGNTAFAVTGIGGGGALLHKAIKDLEDAESRISQDKKEKQEEVSTPESSISQIESIDELDIVNQIKKKSTEDKEVEQTIDGVETPEELFKELAEKKIIKDDEFNQVETFKELFNKLHDMFKTKPYIYSILRDKINSIRDKEKSLQPVDYKEIPSEGRLNVKVQELINKGPKESSIDWIDDNK